VKQSIHKILESIYSHSLSKQSHQRIALVGLGIGSCLLSFLLNVFVPDIYAPTGLYVSVSLICWLTVAISYFSDHIYRHIQDYATFAYLFMYLALVYLTFLTHFEPHHTIILLAAHVLFGLSFKSFVEFVLFALSSLILLIISILTATPLYFDRFMFISTLALFTFAVGLVNWLKEERQVQELEYKNLLSVFLNRHADAIFLLSQDCLSILYKNQAAQKFTSYIFRRPDTTGQALLDLLGLNREFLIKRFETADYHVQERCLCQLNVKQQHTLRFEIYINKIQTRKGDALLLTLRDANRSAYRANSWANTSLNGHEKEPIPLHIEQVDIDGLIQLIIADTKRQFEETHVDFRTHIQDIEGFQTDIKRLSSAIKHIFLSIIHRQKTAGIQPVIFTAVNQDSNFVKFIIQDSGGQIDPHLLKVANRQIEALEAQLSVLEEPDTGNIFTFSLPLTIQPSFAQETSAN